MADFTAGTGGHCPNHEGRSGTAAIAGHPIISLDECSNLGDESRLKCCPDAQASDHVVLIILNRSPRGTRFPITTCRQEGLRARVLAIGGCRRVPRSEEHTSELQSLMRISYAVFCLKK